MTTAMRSRLIIVAAVTVAIIALGVLSASRRPPSIVAPTAPPPAGATLVSDPDISGLLSFGNLPSDHIADRVTYPQVPPVGGAHNQVWQNCGVYSEPLVNEIAVHSLEHGAVWITYDPALDRAQVARLQEITRQSTHRLLSPYPGLPAPIVASAWGFQVRLNSVDDPNLAKFIVRFENGPTTPERGAACTGGIGLTARELGS